jgi:hypothetical protein
MAYLRYYRAGVRRFRLRANLRRLTVEFSLGVVPERLGLAQSTTNISDPDWDPFELRKTIYARFRLRRRLTASGAKQPVLAPAPLKRGAV